MTTGLRTAIVGTDASSRRAAIDRIVVIGSGDVVRKKIWPALQANGHGIAKVAVYSLEREDPLNTLPHSYYRVAADSRLPLDVLKADGFPFPRTLSVIATPSACHVGYAKQLAPYCRVAVEKPLAANGDNGFEVYPIDHKLFNADVLAAVDDYQSNPSRLREVRHIGACFYEAAGISHGRVQEDGIADVQHHLLVPLLAMFKPDGAAPEIAIESVVVAVHEPDGAGRFQAASVWTASRIRGWVTRDGCRATFDLRQAKGAPRDHKAIELYSHRGELLRSVDMGETGWQAHARVLAELLKPRPNMRYDLADGVAVMKLIDHSRSIARVERPYPFGELPDFLE